MTPLTFISLFSGIGGLDLGLERAGLRCVAQVEIDDYACQVLAKHWPDVARYGDIRDCGAHNLPTADVIAGGFPCQDISDAGHRAGLAGQRSGLWAEFHRLVCELRPRYVLVENVAAILHRGMGTVLSDLAASGYDAEWQVLPAAAVGAPHIRERLFLVAYAPRVGGLVMRREQFTAYRQTGREMAQWADQPPVHRMADGVPARVDRLRTLGNAVVPQVAEYIGRCIVAHATDAARAA